MRKLIFYLTVSLLLITAVPFGIHAQTRSVSGSVKDENGNPLPAATVTVNGTAVTSGTAAGPIPLQFGGNLITVTVTAQDGTTTGTYTITVIRTQSSTATLSNLTFDSTMTGFPCLTS